MLRTETVTPGTLELLKGLMQDDNLNDFFLVGGTALSLQIGHRMSIDIDLFTRNSFNENAMLNYLENGRSLQLDYLAKNTIKGQVDNIKVDFITHAYPLVGDLLEVDGIRMANFADIAGMKLNAIVGNGTRLKDFIDIAFLSCHLSLNTMVEAYQQKYNLRNPFIALKAISYHADINFNEPVQMIGNSYSWKAIENRLKEMEKSPAVVFTTSP